jgi:hypothetical protein
VAVAVEAAAVVAVVTPVVIVTVAIEATLQFTFQLHTAALTTSQLLIVTRTHMVIMETETPKNASPAIQSA